MRLIGFLMLATPFLICACGALHELAKDSGWKSVLSYLGAIGVFFVWMVVAVELVAR